MTSFTICAVFTVVCLIGLLVSEVRGSRRGVWIAKPLASTGFVAAAYVSGALETTYGLWILIGLVLSWWGDVLLIPKARPAFLAGLVSFLLGHVAYGVAFAARGLERSVVFLALILLIPTFIGALRWLRPHLSGAMKVPVYVYMVVISLMVLLAAGTVGALGNAWIAVGAFAFYLSDLAVARDRFVSPGYTNRLWGLPLYYGAQLVLAYTVGCELCSR